MVKSQASPEKDGYHLITIWHGTDAGTSEKYTNWTQDTLGHAATPSLRLVLPKNDGVLSQERCKLELPLDTFTTRFTDGKPHSPAFIVVEEVTEGAFSGNQASRQVQFVGRIVRSKRVKGQIARLIALPQKSRLKVRLGMPCNPDCAWRVYGPGCSGSVANPGPQEITYRIISSGITTLDGSEVTIVDSGVTSAAGADASYYRRGWIEKDDLRLQINEWDLADPTKFKMERRPPDDWIGATVIILPGCDQSVEICRSRFNNEEHFTGLGRALPAYHPNFETT